MTRARRYGDISANPRRRKRNGKLTDRRKKPLTRYGFKRSVEDCLGQAPKSQHKLILALAKRVVDNWDKPKRRAQAFAVYRDACLDFGVDPYLRASQKKHRIVAWADKVQNYFPRLSWTKAKQVAKIMKGDMDPWKIKGMQEWERQMHNRPHRIDAQLMALNILLDGYGVEGIEIGGNWVGSFVNMGDTYAATILFVFSGWVLGGDLHLGTYGDFVEWYEHEALDQDDW